MKPLSIRALLLFQAIILPDSVCFTPVKVAGFAAASTTVKSAFTDVEAIISKRNLVIVLFH